jgi:hypothetical protein
MFDITIFLLSFSHQDDPPGSGEAGTRRHPAPAWVKTAAAAKKCGLRHEKTQQTWLRLAVPTRTNRAADKGKPVERRGRKATGPRDMGSRTAGLPGTGSALKPSPPSARLNRQPRCRSNPPENHRRSTVCPVRIEPVRENELKDHNVEATEKGKLTER